MTTTCITGSTDGIGLATARLFAREAADGDVVVVHARSRERGQPVVTELRGEGPDGSSSPSATSPTSPRCATSPTHCGG
ncbi:MAG: hypothetical protein M3P95_07140 [Actinomycetota bacterium]|nr:hypothetical protein [Actinomycetota bacterium]